MSKKFEIYDICVKDEPIQCLKNDFINGLDEKTLYKVISSTYKCWNSSSLYDFNKIFGRLFYDFTLIQKDYREEFIRKFMNDFIYSCNSPKDVKGIVYDDKEVFLYSPVFEMTRKGKHFHVEPALLINRDIYNITKIQFGDFLSVLGDDISSYSQYFTVSDSPRDIVSEDLYEDLFKAGTLNREQYLRNVEYLERREHLVRTLRK